MEKEFVPYKLAVKLKALGFDEPCLKSYGTDGLLNENDHEMYLSAPTFSQAFRWFRENHRMFHEVFIDTEPTVDNPDKLEFTYLILHMVGIEHMYTDKTKGKRFDTYEEAELACLDRLIDVITNKKIFDFVTDL